MFMHSSTMDYAGEITQDLLGLGAYDFAAARMFYGDTVAVHLDPTFNAGTHRGIGILAKTDNFGGIIGFQPTIGSGTSPNASNTRDFHYSQLQQGVRADLGLHRREPRAVQAGHVERTA